MTRLLIALGVALGVALAPSQAAAQARIVIDAGHGGTDPGGVGTGMQEKNVVLDVSKRFQSLLEADTADTKGGGEWTALMTRADDTFVSLAGRSAYSNNQDADRFMSIHSNAFSDTSANGTETFSLASTGTGAALRNLVQAEMISAWGLTNRGNKTASFAVLRDTAAPAVLHELAFITNPTDAAKLGSATERQKAAVAHLRALQRHYNITPYVPGVPAPQDETGEIAGIVVSAGKPIVGATVKLDGGATLATDGEGAFVFTDAPAGLQLITASATGYAPRTVEVTVAAMARQDITIELSPSTGEGEGEGEDGPNVGDATGGCSTQGGAGLWMFAALVFMMRRRCRG